MEVAAVVDARRGETITAAHGRQGVRAVELGDGSRVEADLLVTAVGWTAPTSLLNQSGDNPVYDPRTARFRPDPSRMPENVLAAGGIVGEGDVAQVVEHADAVGREAARRALRTAGTAVTVPDLARRRPPRTVLERHRRLRRPLRGRLGQGHRHRGGGGLRLRRARQALHHRHHGARRRASSRRSTPSRSSPRPPAARSPRRAPPRGGRCTRR